MSLAAAALQAFEGAPIPDPLRRAAVAFLVGSAAKRMVGQPSIDAAFAADMAAHPIAEHTTAANEQHYELPAEAPSQQVLGPHLKYSSCFYEPGDNLGGAEASRARRNLRPMPISGTDNRSSNSAAAGARCPCGWPKIIRTPRSPSVSNSHSQRGFIEDQARSRGLTNLKIITCDMNDFEAIGAYDRVVSVEMFEHMSNWRGLLSRVKTWLKPDGRVFIHVFTHKTTPYRFDVNDKTDWIAQHFFTGGVMPSHGLMHQFGDLFTVEQDWRWSGAHYEKTAEDWLANFDANFETIWPLLVEVYGPDARLWSRRWRLFFLATSGLFGHDGGFGVGRQPLPPEPGLEAWAKYLASYIGAALAFVLMDACWLTLDGPQALLASSLVTCWPTMSASSRPPSASTSSIVIGLVALAIRPALFRPMGSEAAVLWGGILGLVAYGRLRFHQRRHLEELGPGRSQWLTSGGPSLRATGAVVGFWRQGSSYDDNYGAKSFIQLPAGNSARWPKILEQQLDDRPADHDSAGLQADPSFSGREPGLIAKMTVRDYNFVDRVFSARPSRLRRRLHGWRMGHAGPVGPAYGLQPQPGPAGAGCWAAIPVSNWLIRRLARPATPTPRPPSAQHRGPL